MKQFERAVIELPQHVNHDFAWKALLVIVLTIGAFVVSYLISLVVSHILRPVFLGFATRGSDRVAKYRYEDGYHVIHSGRWRRGVGQKEVLALFLNSFVVGTTLTGIALGFYLVSFDLVTTLTALGGLFGLGYAVRDLLTDLGTGIAHLLSGHYHIGAWVSFALPGKEVEGVLARVTLLGVVIVNTQGPPQITFVNHTDTNSPTYFPDREEDTLKPQSDGIYGRFRPATQQNSPWMQSSVAP